MPEKDFRRVGRLFDLEAGERFDYVVEKGKKIFKSSALLDDRKQITTAELGLIEQFHREVSPTNPANPWRLVKEDRSVEKGQIADPSSFFNWESPGGPLEHIELSLRAADFITREMQNSLRPENEINDPAIEKIFKGIREIDPLHASAAAAFHDEGREITHIFYTTSLIGERLLKSIGVREDIRKILPDDKILFTSLDLDMDRVIEDLDPEAIIIQTADIFGKRKAGLNRLQRMGDFNSLTQRSWIESYLQRPRSGRPSEDFFRRNAELFSKNAPRFLEALKHYVEKISTLSFEELCDKIAEQFEPTLRPLNERMPLSSKDLIEGKITKRHILLEKDKIYITAFTEAGFRERPNEDSFSVITDGQNLQIIVVDGGTQLKRVTSLGEMTGGGYIADQVIKNSSNLDAGNSPGDNLKVLNGIIGEDVRMNHPDVSYGQDSDNMPYGSVAAIKIDKSRHILEVANAGDVHVIFVDSNGSIVLLTVDDVFKYDQLYIKKIKEIAKRYGVTFREAMERATIDPNFYPIFEQQKVSIRMNNTGQIPRMSGSNLFKIHEQSTTLDNLSEIYIFSDGAVPASIDIHSELGLKKFTELASKDPYLLIKENNLIEQEDPDFDNYPRIKKRDDMTFLHIKLRP